MSIPATRLALSLLWKLADRSSKRYLAITLVVVLASSGILSFAPLFLKLLIDGFERGNKAAFGASPVLLVVAYVVAHGLSKTLSELQTMYFGFVDQRLKARLSDDLLRHVMALPISFHLNRQTGALNQTLANGLLGYRMLLHHLALTLVPLVVELGTMCTVLIALGHAIFLVIFFVTVGLYILVFRIGAARVAVPAREASKANIEANGVLTDSILNYETVKLFGGEAEIRERFRKVAMQSEGEWSYLLRRKMQNGITVAAVFMLSFGTSASVAVHQVLSGSMTIGEFTLVNAYLLQLLRPIETLGFAVRDFAQGTAYLENLLEIFSVEPECSRGSHYLTRCAMSPELTFDRVCHSYPDGRRALDCVSLVVPSGKTLALVGATGSGKSSLIRLLLRFIEPTSGHIFLNGIGLADFSLPELRGTTAVVPQDTALFDDSIGYNIGFGNPGYAPDDIIRAAKVAHIHEFICRLPNGYRTSVGERGVRLSGGERQRIAIARAIIRRPTILILDEATSALDSVTERAILRDLAQLTQAATTIIIAHRLSTVVHADETVVLDHGRIIERGSHAALLRHRGCYAAMWDEQQGVARSPGSCASAV